MATRIPGGVRFGANAWITLRTRADYDDVNGDVLSEQRVLVLHALGE